MVHAVAAATARARVAPHARAGHRTERGAASSVFAASAPALSGSAPGSWLFIHDNKDAGVLALATDPEVCAKLWDASERFVEWGSHDGDQ
ncbi:hypothetical protein FOA52_011934 [Chlamydomonas sp. UWO 241]|nr:hypothetical protein FOA52_011934 [Chlamydomonas sp. UWO 241]